MNYDSLGLGDEKGPECLSKEFGLILLGPGKLGNFEQRSDILRAGLAPERD